MSPNLKLTFQSLLKGGSIAAFRVRDAKINPVTTLTYDQFFRLKSDNLIIYNKKKGYWVISLKDVRKLHGNTFAKKYYKKLKTTTNATTN